jgi:serine/threonine protein kinase/uncharacterized membrane protein YidH (DUF202 family)
MTFTPLPHLPLTIRGQTWQLAEHPAAPGIAYGQEGRAGTVFKLLPSPLPPTAAPSSPSPLPGGWGDGRALKVFRARFRLPSLVTLAEKLKPFASLPGLQACERIVLTPSQDRDLLSQYPELTYAVLMPWIEGPTWQEVILERKPLPKEQALALARALAETLTALEERGLAHGDLSGPNVMLPALDSAYQPSTHPIALVDVEQMYAPGMDKPNALTSGSMGYAHREAEGGLWVAQADRFAGAVLLAEMLAFCDPQVTAAAWGESYFDPAEMQQDAPRYQTLLESLRRNWGDGVAGLFQRAWTSDSLADCPTFGEWMVALPLAVSRESPAVTPSAVSQLPSELHGSPSTVHGPSSEDATVHGPSSTESTVYGPPSTVLAEIRAFLQAARRMEEKNDLKSAEALYQQALELARSEPAAAEIAKEIELTLKELQVKKHALTQETASPLNNIDRTSSQPSELSQKSSVSTPVTTRNSNRRIILSWILINALSYSVAWAASVLFWNVSGREWNLLIFGLVVGFVPAVAQWLILRHEIKKAGWWVLASIVGWTLAWSIGDYFNMFRSWMRFFHAHLAGGEVNGYPVVEAAGALITGIGFDDYLSALIIGATAGLITGFGQWLILRRCYRKSIAWIFTSIASVTAALALYQFVFSYLLDIGEGTGWWIVANILAGVMIGSVYGIISGFTLRRLIQNSLQPTSDERDQRPRIGVLVAGMALGVFLLWFSGIGFTQQVEEHANATATARAQATATAQAQATATAKARATATAQARNAYISGIENRAQLVFGPADGALEHHEDNLVEASSAAVDLRDFIVEATFYNPYSTEIGSWDYGFLFRDAGGNNQYRLSIHSDKSWNLENAVPDSNGEGWHSDDIAGGDIPNLDVTGNGYNVVKLICIGSTGYFFVNQTFIAEFDLSARLDSGDVRIATGIFNGDEVNGYSTRYDNFRVWSIP